MQQQTPSMRVNSLLHMYVCACGSPWGSPVSTRCHSSRLTSEVRLHASSYQSTEVDHCKPKCLENCLHQMVITAELRQSVGDCQLFTGHNCSVTLDSVCNSRSACRRVSLDVEAAYYSETHCKQHYNHDVVDVGVSQAL